MLLIDYNNIGDNAGFTFTGSQWEAQVFTASISYRIFRVKLLMGRSGNPGTVTVSIRAVDPVFHNPTGLDLCVGTTDGNTLPTASPWEWREITFSSALDLTSGTQYAIIVSVAGAGSVIWRSSATSTYPNGNITTSVDSGSSWTGDASKDFMFETYGGVPPSIVDQSSNTEVWLQDTIILFVDAGGTAPFSYQWYKDANILPGEIYDQLTIDPMTGNDAGTYICVVTNDYRTVNTSDIILTFDSITSQTSSPQNVLVNGLVDMTVIASGSALQYQWYKNDVLIPGQTNNYMTFFGQTSDSGTYKCYVSNIYGSEWSADIVLSVVESLTIRNIFNLNSDLENES